MDPLRLMEIAQDGDFQRVRKLVQENLPLSPDPTGQKEQPTPEPRWKPRNHPWKSPIQRYRNKQLCNSAADTDDDLEELSWKHRSKAYGLRQSDVTSQKVYHWNGKHSSVSEEVTDGDEIPYDEKYPSKGSKKNGSKTYTDRRPKSIETASLTKIDDEEVTTPATVLMDDDEFDSTSYNDCSPHSGRSRTSIELLETSPAAITPPKAVLDQLAMDHGDNSGLRPMEMEGRKHSEGTEVTLEMFEEDKTARAKALAGGCLILGEGLQSIEEDDVWGDMRGTMKKMLAQRSGVKSLIEEHERLMAEAKSKVIPSKSLVDEEADVVVPNNSPNLDNSCDSYSRKEGINVYPPDEIQHESYSEYGENDVEVMDTAKEWEILLDEDDENGGFLARASILTTIVEEPSTPPKTVNPLLESDMVPDEDNVAVERRDCRETIDQTTKQIISQKALSLSSFADRNEDFFKEVRIRQLNKVAMAAALIDYNIALREEARSTIKEKVNNDTRLARAIKNHRKAHGFFTGTTPTHKSMKRNAAIKIQASCRRVLAIRYVRRKLYAAKTLAATLIQTGWRAYDSRMNFKWHIASAAIMQAKWRSYDCQNRYAALRSSVILVQSVARMQHFRKAYLGYKGSSRIVQTKWRSHLCRKRYNLMRSATILVQSITRMHLSRTVYIHKKESALTVQTQWRSFTCRKQYTALQSSNILMQSVVRMYLSRAAYLDMQESARNVQTKWRSYNCQKRYILLRSSTILVQSVARKNLGRMKFINFKDSMTSIQSIARMHLCRTKYIGYKKATIVLQASSRKHFCRTRYLAEKQAAIKSQAVIRRYLCYSSYIEGKKAVTKLQSLSRAYLVHTRFVQSKQAVVVLQAALRMYLYRQKFLQQKYASITVQAAMRMHICHSNHVARKKAAVSLQARSRMYLCQTRYLRQQMAAIVLQRVLRMQSSRAKFHLQQSSALVMQSAIREFLRRKDHATFEAIREIQTRWRSSMCKNDYDALVEIKKIPTSFRTSICKRNFVLYLSSSIIQRGWREYSSRKTTTAARRIQTRWRAFISRKTYTRMLTSATLLQSSFRAFVSRKEYDTKLKGAIKLQSVWRSYSCQKDYLSSLVSAKRMQASFRAYICRKSYAVLVSNRAAVKLESLARMFIRRTKFLKHKASITIQAAARMCICRARFLQFQKATLMIQTSVRAYACRKSYALNLLSTKRSAQHNKAWIDQGQPDNVALTKNVPMDGGESTEDEEEDGIFLGRSSTLTTIVEERSPSMYACSPLESPANSTQSLNSTVLHNTNIVQNDHIDENVTHPATIEKKRSDICVRNFEEDILDVTPAGDIERGRLSEGQCEDNNENLPPTIEKKKLDTEVEKRRLSEEQCEQNDENLPATIEKKKPETSFGKSEKENVEVFEPVDFQKRIYGEAQPQNKNENAQDPALIETKKIDSERSNSKEEILADKAPVDINLKNDAAVTQNISSEVEKRRAELRLLELAAKVAKRRASLKRKTTRREPWQKKADSNKKWRPGLLTKRMGELDKIAKKDKFPGGRQSSDKEQTTRDGDFSENQPIARHPKAFGDHLADENRSIAKKDPVVKKLFVFNGDGNDDNTSASENEVENKTIGIESIDGTEHGLCDFHSEKEDEMTTKLNSEAETSAKLSHESIIEEQSFKINKDENLIFDHIEAKNASQEHRGKDHSWKRNIIDDLAEDIHTFESDSDSDDSSVSSHHMRRETFIDNANNTGALEINVRTASEEMYDLDTLVGEIDDEQRNDQVLTVHSTRKEWSVVDDLIDDIDGSLDEISDTEDSFENDDNEVDRGQTKEISPRSSRTLALFQKRHPLWGISSEDVTESLKVSLYSVAEIAGSLIGITD